MKFVEIPIFTKVVRDVLSDDDYRSMQTAIMFRPEQGVVIRGTGGIRKLLWSGKGHGKKWRTATHILLGQEIGNNLYAICLS